MMSAQLRQPIERGGPEHRQFRDLIRARLAGPGLTKYRLSALSHSFTLLECAATILHPLPDLPTEGEG